jgi:hypothetical protein
MKTHGHPSANSFGKNANTKKPMTAKIAVLPAAITFRGFPLLTDVGAPTHIGKAHAMKHAGQTKTTLDTVR